MPQALSIRAWASEPAMSASAIRWSKSTEAVKRLTRSVTGSEKRPDQPPVAGAPGIAAVEAGVLASGIAAFTEQMACREECLPER